MNILELAILKKMVGGGGGSGTDNYNDLSNLPKINDTTLSGNKSSSALGLQSEINSDSKLASDLVDDTNQDNKFVTSTEKNTWNAKQNAIDSDHKLSSDLVDDANKTNKFVTSTEKNTWNAKQNAIDSEHKLSSSLVSFTDAEAAALASGIDSSKVGQISTNQTNILSVQSSLVGIIRNAGGKNLVKLDDLDYIKSINTQGTWHDNVYTRNSVTFTINDDGTITVNGTNDSSTISAVLNCAIIPYSEFALTGDVISGSVVDGKTEFTISQGAPLYTVLGRSYSGSSAVISQPTEGADEVLISVIVYANQTVDNEVVKPMICTQDSWNQSHEFQPYALNNQDLTKTVENLSYANNTVIPELVNNGSKNLWDFANANVVQVQGIPTYIKTDTDITVSTSSATTQWARVCYKITLPAGNYVWRTKITNFSATSEIKMGVADSLNNQDMTWYRRTQITGNGVFTVEIPNASNGDVYIEFYINFSDIVAPSNTATFSENMICTEADWKISPKFVPYRPNYDLVAALAKNGGFIDSTLGSIIANADLNSINKTTFAVYNEPANLPSGITGYCYVRTSVFDENSALQELYVIQPNPVSFFRIKLNNSWTVWVQTSNV